MERIIPNLSFDGWIHYIFDHPVREPEWFWDDEKDFWDPLKQPAITVQYVTQAFEKPLDSFASSYSDAQINQGLWYMLSNSCSNHMSPLKDEHVPLTARLRALKAMSVVFELVFLPRCSGNLGHLNEEASPPNPLDSVCYMWWDILPIHGASAGPDTIPTANAILEVIEYTLGLGSDSCRESALHGLGHWHSYDPQRIEEMVSRFLDENKDIRPELAAYARRARKGQVQ